MPRSARIFQADDRLGEALRSQRTYLRLPRRMHGRHRGECGKSGDRGAGDTRLKAVAPARLTCRHVDAGGWIDRRHQDSAYIRRLARAGSRGAANKNRRLRACDRGRMGFPANAVRPASSEPAVQSGRFPAAVGTSAVAQGAGTRTKAALWSATSAHILAQGIYGLNEHRRETCCGLARFGVA